MPTDFKALIPDTRPLFPELRAELLTLLEAAAPEAWGAPTACEGWSVKDVALHMLSDDVGFLSRHRDNDGVTFMPESFDHLVALINGQNADWITATRRMSKRLLLSLLRFTGEELAAYLDTIDPDAPSHPVDWAGDAPAPMALQIAREYTEYWMHHQHIADGLGVTSLKGRRHLHPLLSTFVFALPNTYAATTALAGTVVAFTVTGPAEDTWYVVRGGAGWGLAKTADATPTATVTIDGDTAWRLFTKGITPDEAAARTTLTGDTALGRVLLGTVAILA
ncbi:MAG: maleylpyruvate isomerase family mycothiol-dependent enzyme [Chloroflexota bacterium]